MRAPPVVFGLLATASVACSSVPDVQFLDIEGGTASSSGTSGSSGTTYSCPGNPPPAGKGVCCGTKVCLRCTQAHCDRCDRERCDGDEACCGRLNAGASNQVDCRRQTSCN